jgi:hypothetical protein
MKRGLEILGLSLTSGKPEDRPDAALSFEELNDIMGMAEVKSLEEKFLTQAQKTAKYGHEPVGAVRVAAKGAVHA